MIGVMKKILITGGAGCIGIPLAQKLREDFEIVIFDLAEKIDRVVGQLEGCQLVKGSILDYFQLLKASKNCDAVIHLAAMLGVKRTEEEPVRCLELNITGTKAVLTAAQASGAQRFIFASSSEVYGEPETSPITEQFGTQGKTLYAISKLAGEELVKGFKTEFDSFDYSIIRFFNTYGPHQVINFAVPKFLHSAMSGLPIMVNGDGSQIRSYCYSEDSALGVESVLRADLAKNETFNIGNPYARISLSELIDLISKVTSRDLEVKYDPNFKNGDRVKSREIYTRYCDISKAKSLLGFSPSIGIEEGLRLTYQSNSLQRDWSA